MSIQETFLELLDRFCCIVDAYVTQLYHAFLNYNELFDLLVDEYKELWSFCSRFDSFPNDAASIHMIHMVSFHNRIMGYLVIVSILVVVVGLHIFTSVGATQSPKRIFGVAFLFNPFFTAIKVIILYFFL